MIAVAGKEGICRASVQPGKPICPRTTETYSSDISRVCVSCHIEDGSSGESPLSGAVRQRVKARRSEPAGAGPPRHLRRENSGGLLMEPMHSWAGQKGSRSFAAQRSWPTLRNEQSNPAVPQPTPFETAGRSVVPTRVFNGIRFAGATPLSGRFAKDFQDFRLFQKGYGVDLPADPFWNSVPACAAADFSGS